MPTISVKRQPVGSQIKLSIVMTFESTDPQAANIYAGLTALAGQIMTEDSALAFLTRVKEIRRNPKGGEVSGRIKA